MALSSLEITNTSTIDEDARVRCAVLKRHLPALGPATALRSFPGGKFAIGRGLWSDGTTEAHRVRNGGGIGPLRTSA
uniref:Uncharacterized protein n=1 Tax=uncultured actinobacterium HF4000_04C13 TaxID=711002 RepID=E0XVA9_9ACTN|nr:hypothetical protein [uncultured actinobacterium HF4000_04C13]